ncbi:MAG: hypothetical protein QRY72_02885 [Candidatus Rhabdochlamydia sp.]
MKWIYQLFEGAHLFIPTKKKKTEEITLNMNPIIFYILKVLGPRVEKMYSNH